jgi:hypothetical protein
VSHVSECIDLYAYDCEVSDYWFSRMLHEAIEKDAAEGHATGAARQIARLRAQLEGKTLGMQVAW